MSNNTTLNPGVAGDSIRTIDKAGTKTQVVTLDLGGSGVESLVAGSIPVTGTFWQATQPVSGTFWQATQPVSIASWTGLTDTQLRATPVPVSGTFWQTTQPVSGTVAVSNASFPVTDNAGSLTVDAPVTTPVFVRLSDGAAAISTLPVSIATMPSTPVTGTFWQATQPVSIASWTGLTDTQLRASAVPVSVASLPLPTGASTETTLSTLNGKVTACNTGAVTISAVPAITKGTQGSTGFAVQDLKDSGRSARTITLDSFAVAATAETLMTMSFSTDNGTLTTGTSYSVTTGKRLRLQSMSVGLHTITGNTTAVNVIVRIRANNAGAALVSSPVQLVVPVQGIAAANNAGMPVFIDWPDGWEFVAGAGIGVTVTCAGFVATTAAPKVDITIVGYEY